MAAAVSSSTQLPRTFVGCVASGSILDTSKDLRSTGKDEIPKDLMSATADSSIGLDKWSGFAAIDVIDLSPMQTHRAGVVKQIHKAVTERGIFQIVNHGVSLEVLDDVLNEGFKFFELPLGVKEKAGLSGSGAPRAYVGDNTKQSFSSLCWAESLTWFRNSLDHIWPDGNEKFLDAVTKYSSGIETIAKQLLELIAEGLGLSTDFFAKEIQFDAKMMRWNFYPACPRPTEIMGAAPHTDPICLTLLLHDKVGGYQIEQDGEWMGIRPIEGALMVNIGDMLQAWSNGMCKSVLHRVVVNKEVHRLSLAAFWNLDLQFPVSAPEELIDESHPQRYKTITPMEYLTYTNEVRDDNNGTVMNGKPILENKFKFKK